MNPELNSRFRKALLIAGSMVVVFVLTRISLHASPDSNFDVAGYNIHHLYTGVLLLIGAAIPLVLGLGQGKIEIALNVTLGAGLALVLDEWVYLIVTDGSDASYLLPVSFWGGVLLTGLAAAYLLILGRK